MHSCTERLRSSRTSQCVRRKAVQTHHRRSWHAHVGVEITHDSSSYINFMGCSYLAQRGYTVLCADGPFGNATFANQFAYYGLEQVVSTVASAINYLRNNVSSPGIDKVIIF